MSHSESAFGNRRRVRHAQASTSCPVHTARGDEGGDDDD